MIQSVSAVPGPAAALDVGARRAAAGAKIPGLPGGHLAELTVTSTPSRLTVDTTQGREEIGYFAPTPLARQRSAHALRSAERAVATTVSDGYRLATPNSGPAMIPRLAFEHAVLSYREQQFGLAFVPKSPPRISYTPGETRINLVY